MLAALKKSNGYNIVAMYLHMETRAHWGKLNPFSLVLFYSSTLFAKIITGVTC